MPSSSKTVFEWDSPPRNTFLFYPEDGPLETVGTQKHNPYEKELQYFVDCIRGEADPEQLDGQHAIEALKTVDRNPTITARAPSNKTWLKLPKLAFR
jgi:predicted dehydrogenase